MEPYSLVNVGHRWYLLARDRDRSDWRTFRVDRILRPAPTGVRFTARKLPTKDAATYVEQSLSAAPNRYEARVTLHAPADAVRGQVPSAWGTIEPIDERSCEYRTGDDDLDMARPPGRDAGRRVRGSRAAGARRAPAHPHGA